MPTTKGTFDLHGTKRAMLDSVKVKNVLQRTSNAGGLKTINKCKMHPCGPHVFHPEEMGESDYVQTVDANKQQVAKSVRGIKLHENEMYPSTAGCGLMSNLNGIPGCKDTPEDVQGIPGCVSMPEDVRTRKSQEAKSCLMMSLNKRQ